MLRGLILENFKAFGERHVMPLAPITLIFGPNSAGKSSILQSLLLLQQSMDREGSPPFRFRGSSTDLGNFSQTVFRHDIGRVIEITPILGLEGPWQFGAEDLSRILEQYPVINHRFGAGVAVRFDESKKSTQLQTLPFYIRDLDTPAFWGTPLPSILRDEGKANSLTDSPSVLDSLVRFPFVHPGHSIYSELFVRFMAEGLDSVLSVIRQNIESNGEHYRQYWEEENINAEGDLIDFRQLMQRFECYCLADYLEDLRLGDDEWNVRVRRFLLDFDHMFGPN